MFHNPIKVMRGIVCLVVALFLTAFFVACSPIENEVSGSDDSDKAKTAETTETRTSPEERETTTRSHDEQSGIIELPRIPFQTEK